ncbi:hypothetical protein [Polyangium mundeleinium]|uniref:DUF4189 domain-containing protein n=1 Tax=Polyangium mundeleinium TaxID=2995306 RepID=A0ABT5EZB9_9BACT|nr:hypothetical protein [Polyangium mundeleinium]MDC0746714.1 hypothetical protein [Polyangium mundeleinium]
MNNANSIFVFRFVSAALMAGSAVMAGCMASPEPEGVEEALIDESGAMGIPAQSEMKLERRGEGESLSLVPNAAWKELAPGVWENGEQEGANRIVVGAEGHKWAIEQAEKELSELQARSASQAEEEPAVNDAIAQRKAQLANLQETAKNIAAAPGSANLTVSCDIGFYTGPSSSVSGYSGAAALAQVSCIGGCETFTISAQACTNFGCSPVYASSRVVCSTPWTYGVTKSGTYGASCSSAASVSPPGIMSSWSGSCG